MAEKKNPITPGKWGPGTEASAVKAGSSIPNETDTAAEFASTVPDAIGKLRGFRAWEALDLRSALRSAYETGNVPRELSAEKFREMMIALEANPYQLCSPFRPDHVWNGNPIQAMCPRGEHLAPDVHCQCGLYAYVGLGDALLFEKTLARSVPGDGARQYLLGGVKLWGKIEQHGRGEKIYGYRAQIAQIDWFLKLNSWQRFIYNHKRGVIKALGWGLVLMVLAATIFPYLDLIYGLGLGNFYFLVGLTWGMFLAAGLFSKRIDENSLSVSLFSIASGQNQKVSYPPAATVEKIAAISGVPTRKLGTLLPAALGRMWRQKKSQSDPRNWSRDRQGSDLFGRGSPAES